MAKKNADRTDTVKRDADGRALESEILRLEAEVLEAAARAQEGRDRIARMRADAEGELAMEAADIERAEETLREMMRDALSAAAGDDDGARAKAEASAFRARAKLAARREALAARRAELEATIAAELEALGDPEAEARAALDAARLTEDERRFDELSAGLDRWTDGLEPHAERVVEALGTIREAVEAMQRHTAAEHSRQWHADAIARRIGRQLPTLTISDARASLYLQRRIHAAGRDIRDIAHWVTVSPGARG